MGKRKKWRHAQARKKNKGVFYRPGDSIEVRLWDRAKRDFSDTWHKAIILRINGSKFDFRIVETGEKHHKVGYAPGNFNYIRPAPAVDQLGDLVRE